MTTTHDTPRVWIGALGAYNAGHLIGQWTEATDVDILRTVAGNVLEAAREKLGAEGGEEIMLADNEGFGDLIGEYTPLDKVAEIGALIEEHGPAYIAYAENVGADYADSDGFDEAYCGEYDSERAYAEELAEEIGAIPDDLHWPMTHIDWDSAARDLRIGGDNYFIDSPSGVYVFRNI